VGAVQVLVVVVELGERCLSLRRRFRWWFVASATTDEVWCGEVVTLALDLLMSCVLASLILVSLTRYQIC
jgi:hypothetical protein